MEKIDIAIPEYSFYEADGSLNRYNYAQKYWGNVCSDGYFFEQSHPPTYLGAGASVPSECGYEAVRGYFLATFPAMRIYFKILKSLREKGLTNKISVEEVLFELSKVTKIVEKSGREYFAMIPERARRMCSLFPEVLPMG